MFKNITFPLNIAKNSSGGPQFATKINQTISGVEYRTSILQYPKIKYNISTGINSKEDIDAISAFFRLCMGQKYSFRFRDFVDFSAQNQKIAIGDGILDSFQIIKSYIIDDEYIERKITKPLSVIIYIDNKVCDKSLYDVDFTTGIIKFKVKPASGQVITADFVFDIEMRFDTDFLNIMLYTNTSYQLKDVNLIEVL
ncbi:DUF2460 domain-containing protein [Candidatus Deianiraea vastatrix]|uniref:Phage glycoside hydrolase n=1 Tax=Candidatus Deianiraea vastatrix TaxID=2163644 RepID=A0A5B8XD36_9RICK|nr:DUF2460 domain-containing protein [Candidatus Deianiraea vastatrix]QED22936.1 Putative phage glycoside hydrolase [Candidatus Deianiraea vastatrix]